MNNNQTLPLSFADCGKTYEIQNIRGNNDVARHLQDIGFVQGTKIKVLSSSKSGIEIRIRDSKLALDIVTCSKITVREYNPKLTNEEELGL